MTVFRQTIASSKGTKPAWCSPALPYRSVAELSVVFIALFLVLLPIALSRLIARDEGFYLFAARLVMEGEVPYRDFFYPQMPLLPYLYGWWMKIFSFSWVSGRVFSAFLAASLGTLVYLHLRGVTRILACIGIFAFCFSAFSFPWFTTAQTYAPSTLFLFGALVVSLRAPSAGRAMPFLAGVLFGSACLTRLIFGSTLPVFLFLMTWQTTHRMRNVVMFLLGGIFVSTPLLYFLVFDPTSFWFNNMGYHLSRSEMDSSGVFEAKVKVFSVVTGLRSSRKFVGVDFPLIVWGSTIFTVIRAVKFKELDPFFLVGACLFLTCFIPTPMYVQYFSVTVPFFLVSFLSSGWQLAERVRAPTQTARSLLRWAPASALTVLVTIAAPIDIHRYLVSGIGVTGLGERRHMPDWEIQTVDLIGESLNTLTKTKEGIVAFWPGYFVSSTHRPLRGLENQFGVVTADKLDDQALHERFRMMSEEKAWASLGKTAQYVILNVHELSRRERKAIKELSLIPLVQIEKVTIFEVGQTNTQQ